MSSWPSNCIWAGRLTRARSTSVAKLCRAFLARRRGGPVFRRREDADRRSGGLKMDWTKPLDDRQRLAGDFQNRRLGERNRAPAVQQRPDRGFGSLEEPLNGVETKRREIMVDLVESRRCGVSAQRT